MNEVFITNAVTLLVCMINNYFQNKSVQAQNNKTSTLVVYRLEQLEIKVQAHNNLVERMYRVEEENKLLKEQIKVANHRISDLEKARN
jgi:hypothetical protein